MSFTEKRRVAIHQAGHAVANLLIGHGPRLVTIKKKEGTFGWATRFDNEQVTQERLRERIVSLYAGAEAERRVSPDENKEEFNAIADVKQAEEYLPYCGGTEEELRKVATDLVRAHWALVERIAAELLEYKTLERGELNTIFNIYCGMETEGDLAAYRERAA